MPTTTPRRASLAVAALLLAVTAVLTVLTWAAGLA